MNDLSSLESLFFNALEKETAAERVAYLNSACAGDAEVRRQVEKLLRAHTGVGGFLNQPAVMQFAAPLNQSDATAGPNDPTDGRNIEDAVLDFLHPSTRPEALGRIGHYEVLEVLGHGGFGIVFRAIDEKLQRVVAVKVLAPEFAASPSARQRFLREAQASASIRHEHVVGVYAVEESPTPYLVMECIAGQTLQQRLNERGRLDVPTVVRLGRQIAEGLAAAHAQRLIHRDIKPGNILLETAANDRVKISDFGVVRAADDATATQHGALAGTPMFMAPEQAAGETLDHRADLFSFGSVLYTMCCGHAPFRGKSTFAVLRRVVEDPPPPIQEIAPETPPWLCEIISRLHAKNPEDRFATASEVADVLGCHLAQFQHAANVSAFADATPATQEMTPLRNVPEAKPPIPIRRLFVRPVGRRWVAAFAVILMLGGGLSVSEATGVTDFHGTVIRLIFPEGTLIVEVDDPGVSVQIDGAELVITGAGAKEIRLRPGRYTVEARKDGKLVRRELVSVTNNGRQVVRIRQEPATSVTKAVSDLADPDRRAAEYVLSLGGLIRVNNMNLEISAAVDLPKEAFRLTHINLFRNRDVSDAGLAAFRDCRNLKDLNLWEVQMSDAALANFSSSRNLEILQLPATNVSDAGLVHFKDCKDLTILWLQHNIQISDAGLTHFTGCTKLTQLHLHGTQVSDAGLVHLMEFRKLTDLRLPGTKVTAAGIDLLKEALPECRILWDGGVIEPRAESHP
jgi:eukaryotic-like serine/threonine-protein kinase